MTPAEWWSIALYALVAAGLGRLVLRWLQVRDRTFIDSPATCYLTGQLGLLLLTVATAYGCMRLSTMLPFVLVLGIGGSSMLAKGMLHRLLEYPSRALASLLALSLFFLAFPASLAASHSVATVEWDARMLWMFHGKALFFGDGVRDAFFGDPQLWWTNLDYPLLLPAQAAWSAQIAGGWNSLACKAHLLATLAAWFALLHKIVLRVLVAGDERGPALPPPVEQVGGNDVRMRDLDYRACWLLSTLVSMALMTLGTHTHAAPYDFVSGMADRHYATPLLLTALATSPLLRPTPWLLLAILLAYSANTKNEAAVYVLLLLACWATFAVARGRLRASSVRSEGPAIAIALLLGLTPLAAWKAYALSHAIPGGLALDDQVGDLAQRVAVRLPNIVKHLLHRLHDAGAIWTGLAFLAATLVGWRRHNQVPVSAHEAGVIIAALTVCGLLCLVFLLTPHDYVLHMDMAMARLVVLPSLLLGAATVLRVARVARHTTI